MTKPRRTLTLLLLTLAALALAPALGSAMPPPDDTSGWTPPPDPTITVVSHTAPLWAFVAVAVCSALLTAAAILGLTRLRRESAAHATA